nr:RecName: Full=Phosphoglycerate kinase [Mycobacterium avium]
MAVHNLKDLLAEGVSGRGVLVRSDLNVPLDSDGEQGRITDPGPDHRVGADVERTGRGGRQGGGRRAPRASQEWAGPGVVAGPGGRRARRAAGPARAAGLGRGGHRRPGPRRGVDRRRRPAAGKHPVRRPRNVQGRRRAARAGRQMAELVGPTGAFVSDGFGVVHRKQASVYDVATLLPHYAGTLVAEEIAVLEQLTGSTKRPYAVVLGGSKVSDKLGVIESLATKADSIVIGGGMCFTFLAAQGFSVGKSLVETEMVDTCRRLLDTYVDVLRLPVDMVAADRLAADAAPQTVPADAIPDDLMGVDIGPGSVKRFTALLSNAETMFWNGPMGVFEFPAFAAGTKGLAEAIAAATGKGAFSVVGGGDSAAATAVELQLLFPLVRLIARLA